MSYRCLLVALPFLWTAGCFGKSLDKDGGVILVYPLAEDSDTPPETVVTAIRQRLEGLVPRGQFQVRELEDGKIEITLIGVTDEELATATKALRATGELEFRIVALRGKDDELIAAAEADQPAVDQDRPFARWVSFDPERCQMPEKAVTSEKDGQHRVLVVDDELDVTAEMLASVNPSLTAEGWEIDGQLSPLGANMMRQLTGRNLPSGDESRQLAILFDGEVISAPTITSEISDRFRLTGDFSESEARFITAVLKVGQLPVRLDPQPVSEKKVPPRK